jgi:DNA-binding NarL/FixJ family response regulator
MDPERLMAAVQNGEIWAPRKLVPCLIDELLSLIDKRQKEDYPARPDARLEKLTARQRVIADLVSGGTGNKEIAHRLNITERTVKAHLTEAFRNVGVSDRLQLALLLKGYPLLSGEPGRPIQALVHRQTGRPSRVAARAEK